MASTTDVELTLAANANGRGRGAAWKKIKRSRFLYLLLLAPILWYVVFAYLPMVGVLIAFQDFSLYKGVFHSDWAGFEHFKRALTDAGFWAVFRNTVILGTVTFLFGFPAPIVLALLFNELRDGLFKKAVQTISYLPYFVSVVAIVNIAMIMLSPSTGVVNGFLKLIGLHEIYFIIEPGWFRPIYVLINLWVGTGWTSIIYLAAMSSIDTQLYDAAKVDGASRFRQIWHVTLPGIAPTITILLLISLPSIVATNFEMVLLLQQPITYSTSDVVGTYIYRHGILNSEFDYTTAATVIFSIISLAIIFASNRFARKFGETSLW